VAASAQTGPYAPRVAFPGTQAAAAGSPGPTTNPQGGAAPSTWNAAVTLEVTGTDNVNLTSSDLAQSGMVTEITPVFGVHHRGGRTSLNGFVSLPVTIYVPSGVASDRMYPALNLLGDVMIVDQLLYVEGLVNISQQFYNPFGAQPVGLANPTRNRYRSDLYRITPYIKGTTQAGTTYLLRNDNVWTNLSGAPLGTNNANYTTFAGNATNTTTTVGWTADFDYTETRFNTNAAGTLTTQIYRAAPVYRYSSSLQLAASAGYEDNRGTVTSSKGFIYGVGFVWRPTPRTSVIGNWEERFFGSAYNFSFDHATPLSYWRLNFSRNITTYPQQIASLPVGVNVASFLNALFLPQISDPAQRQQLVEQLIQERGLPATLTSPVNLYGEQILLQQRFTGTVGLIGARNTVVVTGYYLKSEPITASGLPLPPGLFSVNDNTQTGGSATWTYQLTPTMNFVLTASGNETTSNATQAETRRGTVRVGVSRPLSPNTTAYAGARYQELRSNTTQNYTEAAAFLGLVYTFR
jgi:uncharacterized protein (PEP-CTERM system associated)